MPTLPPRRRGAAHATPLIQPSHYDPEEREQSPKTRDVKRKFHGDKGLRFPDHVSIRFVHLDDQLHAVERADRVEAIGR